MGFLSGGQGSLKMKWYDSFCMNRCSVTSNDLRDEVTHLPTMPSFSPFQKEHSEDVAEASFLGEIRYVISWSSKVQVMDILGIQFVERLSSFGGYIRYCPCLLLSEVNSARNKR